VGKGFRGVEAPGAVGAAEGVQWGWGFRSCRRGLGAPRAAWWDGATEAAGRQPTCD